MKLYHGSTKDLIDQNFDVFDYIVYQDNTTNHEFINNGDDAYGIGIYTYTGEHNDCVKKASNYASKDSGFVYVMELDIDEKDLMNNRKADEISIDELAITIKDFIKELTIFKEKSDNNNIDNIFEYINKQGTPEKIASDSIDMASNLSETINNIGSIVATIPNKDLSEDKYNKIFQNSVLKNLKSYNLIATYIEDNQSIVVFDTTKIEIIDKIDVNNNLKNKRKLKRRF